MSCLVALKIACARSLKSLKHILSSWARNVLCDLSMVQISENLLDFKSFK